MNFKIKDNNTDFLFEGVLSLKNMEECYRFFNDLCTGPEVKALAQRFKTAQMLRDGSIYSDIVDETGISTATISRVKRSLSYGSDGYTIILNRLEGKETP